jgi:hypothetical protein
VSSTAHGCISVLRVPTRAGQVWRCWCGQGWHVTTVNDVFTGGPLLIWARVGRWDLRARRRLTRQSRSSG